MTTSSGLERFITAQQDCYNDVVRELTSGRKQTHWMWFIFPQLVGLGRSSTAQYYAITGMDEARRYLDHPVLGARLRECTAIVNGLEHRTAHEIFGSPDDLKFHSSMTLFDAAAVGKGAEFSNALKKYYGGARDASTLRLLAALREGRP